MPQNSNVFNFISYKWHIYWISLHAFASILLSQEVHFFKIICLISQANGVPDLDFDIDIPPWNEMDTCSISTGALCHTAAQNKDYINKSKRDIIQG